MDRPDLCLFLELETETILYFFYERPEKFIYSRNTCFSRYEIYTRPFS